MTVIQRTMPQWSRLQTWSQSNEPCDPGKGRGAWPWQGLFGNQLSGDIPSGSRLINVSRRNVLPSLAANELAHDPLDCALRRHIVGFDGTLARQGAENAVHLT